MKIGVSCKRVVDYRVKVRVKADGSGADIEHAKMSLNPFDEIALEEAVRMKEAGLADEVVAISLGTKSCQETLRNALAMGADRALWIETQQALEPLHVAKGLAAVVKQEKFDCVLMGKQAIDDDCNQTGQMLAALLNWPAATFASKIIIKGKSAEVTREVDGGLETILVNLPAVITCDLRLNKPRYPSLPNIMKAKQKPIASKVLTELIGPQAAHTQIIEYLPPTERQAGIKVADFAELIAALQKENLHP